VRALQLTTVLDPKTDLLQDSDLHQLGAIRHGTGDPAGLAVVADRNVIVALAGVGEVAIGAERNLEWKNLRVAQRPTAIVPSPDGKQPYVANTFADSVSVVDLKADKVVATITLGSRPELKSSDRGELLFHDARLSHDGWMSCQSCHTDGHSNGQLGDTLGDGSYGAPKRVPSLLGTGTTGPWAWNGAVQRREDQARKSLETTTRAPDPPAPPVP